MNGVRPTVILYGENDRLARELRQWRVRKADHLIALLDEIRACIGEFGTHHGHAVVCDLREDDEVLALLLRLRRTSGWTAPILVLHENAPRELCAAAERLGGFSLFDAVSQIPAALDRVVAQASAR